MSTSDGNQPVPSPPLASSSSYILLNPSSSLGPIFDLPRPRCWPILFALASIDLLFTSIGAVRLGFPGNENAVIGSGFVRSITIGWVTSSNLVRQRAFVVAFASALTLLVALWRFNELVQTSTFSSNSNSPIIQVLIMQVTFACLHWIGFVTLVGVTTDRNPWGLFNSRAPRGRWSERHVDDPGVTIRAPNEQGEGSDGASESEIDDDDVVDSPLRYCDNL